MKYRTDMHIYIDNLTYGNEVTHNLSDIINYVLQYRFQGGPEQPIRYLELKVNKNDIDKAYPSLIDSVVEGKTRLLIDAVDGGTFIITKLWLKDNEYDIVATGIEVTLNTATLSASLVTAINSISSLDPPKIVKEIFDDWKNTLNLTSDDDFKIYFSDSLSDSRTPPGYKISFKENMPTLVAINMCALLDNAFVFFADKEWDVEVDDTIVKKRINTMYYVTYDDIPPLAYNPGDSSKNGVVNIYPRMDSQYVTYTRFDLIMYQRLIGLSSKNSEGSETIINNQLVSMEGAKEEASNQYSMEMYGDYAGTTVMSDLMISYSYSTSNTAEIIAQNLVQRYKDPTRSITIELSEVEHDNGGSGWEGIIEPFSYAYRIVDNVNNITLTNTHLCEPDQIGGIDNPAKTDNFMLRLSTFIRSYPELTTEYTFGVMKETTLSQELANKLTGMSGTLIDIRNNGVSLADNGIVTADSTPSSTSQTPAHLITSYGLYEYLNGTGNNFVHQTGDENNIQGKKTFKDELTIDDKLVVNGDIYQYGSSYETHAQQVYTTDDYIIMRDGATTALANNTYSGFQVKKYDGTNDGRLVIDKTGTARVGDVGDEQPLMTRNETSSMTDGSVIKWDNANVKGVTYANNESLSTTDVKPLKMVDGVLTAVQSNLATGDHVHGNITNDGKIGTTANKPVVTGTDGVLTAGSVTSPISMVSGSIAHATSGADAGTYGSSTKTVTVKVNATGHVEEISDTNIPTDNTPTENSNNFVKSGGVYSAIMDVFSTIYPVGSIYMSMNSTMPTILAGLGTWELLGEGSAIISAGSNYPTGLISGSSNTRTISESNLPAHTHSIGSHTHTMNAHSHSISNDGSGSTSFGPLVIEGQSSGGDGHVDHSTGTLSSGFSKRTGYSDNQRNADDSVASSGSDNKSRYVNLAISNHNHGGSTGTNSDDVSTTDLGNTGSTGSGTAFNVMQQSYAVYVWRRTA